MITGAHDGKEAETIFGGVAGAVATHSRRQIAERALARSFEPSEQTIRNWIKQTELDAGSRGDGLTTDERDELARLRENARLKEREILSKAAAWFAQEKNSKGPSRS